MVIAVDFDGTCVRNEYPKVGKDLPLSVETLKKIEKNGHQIILYTMRDGKELQDAVNWFKKNEISLYGINENPSQNWTTSRKVYANYYIDDAAVGTPVKFYKALEVDWEKIEKILKFYKIL